MFFRYVASPLILVPATMVASRRRRHWSGSSCPPFCRSLLQELRMGFESIHVFMSVSVCMMQAAFECMATCCHRYRRNRKCISGFVPTVNSYTARPLHYLRFTRPFSVFLRKNASVLPRPLLSLLLRLCSCRIDDERQPPQRESS